MFRDTIYFKLSYTQILVLPAPWMALAVQWSVPCCFTDTLEKCIAMVAWLEQFSVLS